MRGQGEHFDWWSPKALESQGQNCQSIKSVILIKVLHDAGDGRHGQVGPLHRYMHKIAFAFLNATILLRELRQAMIVIRSYEYSTINTFCRRYAPFHKWLRRNKQENLPESKRETGRQAEMRRPRYCRRADATCLPSALRRAALRSEVGINGGGDGTWGPLRRRESCETGGQRAKVAKLRKSQSSDQK